MRRAPPVSACVAMPRPQLRWSRALCPVGPPESRPPLLIAVEALPDRLGWKRGNPHENHAPQQTSPVAEPPGDGSLLPHAPRRPPRHRGGTPPPALPPILAWLYPAMGEAVWSARLAD